METDRELLSQVLALQRALIPASAGSAPSCGFVVGSMTENELAALVGEGKLYSAKEDGRLVAYLLVTPIAQFLEFSNDPRGARFEPDEPIDLGKLDYLYQIGVAPNAGKRGLGSWLLSRCFAERQRGLVTDVILEPLRNEASLSFFLKNGFREVGTLHMDSYRSQGRDYGKMRSSVLLWEPRR